MSPRRRAIRWTLFGTVLGMCCVAMFIGAKIGLEQSGQWPAWIAVPLGAVMGPFYLAIDALNIYEGWKQPLIALPMSVPGGMLGAILGWMLAKAEEKRDKANEPA